MMFGVKKDYYEKDGKIVDYSDRWEKKKKKMPVVKKAKKSFYGQFKKGGALRRSSGLTESSAISSGFFGKPKAKPKKKTYKVVTRYYEK